MKNKFHIEKTLFFAVIIASLYGILAIFSATRSLGTNSNVIIQAISMGIGLIALIILTAGLYNLSFVQNMKNNATGVFREFNFERITWMLPPNWFAILGLALVTRERNVDLPTFGRPTIPIFKFITNL